MNKDFDAAEGASAKTTEQKTKDQGYARVRWKAGLFRVWIVGLICWVVYSLWSDAAEVEDWTCGRRLLGIDEGPRCAINTEGLIESVTEIFFPPLVVGIALLAVAWIVAGFQPRTHPQGAKMNFLKGVYSAFTAGPDLGRGAVYVVGWLVGWAIFLGLVIGSLTLGFRTQPRWALFIAIFSILVIGAVFVTVLDYVVKDRQP
jgi:hypothetical protein